MGKKLLLKAGLVSTPMPAHRPGDATPIPGDASKPKTAPGSMLHFMSQQSTAIREVDELRERLKDFDGAVPVRALDPAKIRPSKWANRHQMSFAGIEFESLKEEIQASGGNVQPIKVRPIAAVLHGATPSDATGSVVEYEVVFGHRRHRACFELGVPVLAVIEETSDLDLFQQMERENRSRKNLSPWEQGCMYRQALDGGLYSSLRKLAEGVGVDVSLVSRSIALARLPDAVINAFPSPLEVQFGWAAELSDVVQKDPEKTIVLANSLQQLDPRPNARQVFERLTARGADKALHHATPAKTQIKKNGMNVASIALDTKGQTNIRISANVLKTGRHAALVQLIEDFLSQE